MLTFLHTALLLLSFWSFYDAFSTLLQDIITHLLPDVWGAFKLCMAMLSASLHSGFIAETPIRLGLPANALGKFRSASDHFRQFERVLPAFGTQTQTTSKGKYHPQMAEVCRAHSIGRKITICIRIPAEGAHGYHSRSCTSHEEVLGPA